MIRRMPTIVHKQTAAFRVSSEASFGVKMNAVVYQNRVLTNFVEPLSHTISNLLECFLFFKKTLVYRILKWPGFQNCVLFTPMTYDL